MLSILAVIIVMIVKTPEESPDLVGLGLALIVAGFAALWGILALSIKRVHDIGWPIIVIVLLILPVVFLLLLAVLPGSQETNSHGPPPFPDK